METKEIDLNVRDCWDSTPLYYACHCGHKATVEYLLANGARCESNTFDGERCLYGALTDEIKRLLQDSKLLGSVKKRDEFDEFCEVGKKKRELTAGFNRENFSAENAEVRGVFGHHSDNWGTELQAAPLRSCGPMSLLQGNVADEVEGTGRGAEGEGEREGV